ncbi:MAG TPA: SIMPL domain-containing protein [Nitrososphaeraceae archaeon]|nr:SIMPL domain-containing protein [Nitrososphaeraceae archaeon]
MILIQKTYVPRMTIALISILAVLIVISTIHANIIVNAQLDSTYALNNTLFVSGSATANTKTDKVTVSLGVETADKTAEKALLSNSNLMNTVIDALKASGLQQNETSTSSFSIKPNYNYSKYGDGGNLMGFTVSNLIHIESSNINSVSQWIDTAVQAGANIVNDIYFSVSEEKLQKIKNVLLKEAVANAKTKADIVAGAAGINVGGIKSIMVEEIGFPPVPGPLYSKSVSSDEVSSTPILAGEQEVSTKVSIVYMMGR